MTMSMINRLHPVVAIDIGGTKFITAVIDSDGNTLSRIYSLTRREQGPHKIIQRLIASVRVAVKKSGLEAADISALGVAFAGIIDSRSGLVSEAPNIWRSRNIKLRDILAAELQMPVYLMNDASAAALGENGFGAGRGSTNMIYLTVSTGIGGGIIIDGELYEGTDGCAGELGHTIIAHGGPECKCGKCGCLESLASGTAIARMARERLDSGEDSLLRTMIADINAELRAEEVAEAARKGDKLAIDVIQTAACWLGVGLGNIANIFNPQLIVIGGGVSRIGEMFFRPARKAMKQHAFRLPARTVRVVKAQLGADSGLLGAAVYIVHKRNREE